MIWQSPWAWIGIATIVVPILVHLLGRDRAPRQAFPSLRFIEIAELPPTRRTRLHDVLLLATRVAIIVVAVAALAQPLLLNAGRRASIDDRLARAIIVDTSASMSRPVKAGVRALDSARGEARRLANSAHTSITVETALPQSVIGGAIGWLDSQRSRRELVVISDFQTGVLDSATVAAVPAAVGIQVIPIPVQPIEAAIERAFVGRTGIVARVGSATDATNVSWMLENRGPATTDPRIEIHASDSARLDAVSAAAKTVGVALPIDTATRVAVVFANASDRDALIRRATRVTSPHLIDLVARVRVDPLLVSARGADAPATVDSSLSRLGPVVISDPSGRALVVAAEDTLVGSRRLLVFSNDEVGTLRSAALVAALRRAMSIAPPIGELDPSTIPAPVIASWQRAPSAAPSRENLDSVNGPSDGRWLWLLVLGLLGIESWLRRERRTASIHLEESVHDRAA